MSVTTPSAPADSAVLTRKALFEFLRIKPSHGSNLIAAGKLPRGATIGKRKRIWLRSEIEAWLAAGAPPAARWESIKAAK
jgi:predicted DNA-binding transcriptional regulator AlpA